MNSKCCIKARGPGVSFLIYYFKKHFKPCFFISKALKDILQHFKFVNWWIGEFVISFFWCHEQVHITYSTYLILWGIKKNFLISNFLYFLSFFFFFLVKALWSEASIEYIIQYNCSIHSWRYQENLEWNWKNLILICGPNTIIKWQEFHSFFYLLITNSWDVFTNFLS